MVKELKLLAGSANKRLAKEVSSYLNIPLTPITIKHFSDGEIYVKIEKSVRGADIFLIQSTSPNANEHLMELLLTVDALKRASANEVTAVIPYYGYSRQDRKATPREPISAKLVADLLTTAGVNRVITFDLHVDQIQGFFNIPVDNLEVTPLIAEYLLNKGLRDFVIISPDTGGVKRARRLAKLLEKPLAIIDKRRPKHGEARVMHIIGEVKGKDVVIVDDIIDTAGTIINATKALKDEGAKDVYVYATHALFSGPALERLKDSNIKEVIITNSIEHQKAMLPKIKIISIASLLAECIRRIHKGKPLGVLFEGLSKKITKRVSK